MIAVRQDKRQGNIYFESERHITINVSSIALLNQLNQLNLGLALVVTVMTLTCQCGNGTTQTDQCGSSRHGPANMKLVHTCFLLINYINIASSLHNGLHHMDDKIVQF